MKSDVSIEVQAQISQASNATFLCVDPASGKEYVYKPVQGERPLWDFPEGSLSGREIAASEMDRLVGWDLLPTTLWIPDGPFGQGMLQEWVQEIDSERPVNLFSPGTVPAGWITVLSGETLNGEPVALAHANTESLQKLALFDAIINNSDRKAGHILATGTNRIFGIDHGVSFHEDDKLRTVIWGWAGMPIPPELLSTVEACFERLGSVYEPIDKWLNSTERAAFRLRIHNLIETKTYPLPSPHWPAIPWPVF